MLTSLAASTRVSHDVGITCFCNFWVQACELSRPASLKMALRVTEFPIATVERVDVQRDPPIIWSVRKKNELSIDEPINSLPRLISNQCSTLKNRLSSQNRFIALERVHCTLLRQEEFIVRRIVLMQFTP
ncbi:hypothetical protein SAMN05421753_112208 [Planctomicrobium piriforme]|uniref:Uncharacterized protein n=1 Tax=Planctomicrobium piriforme TaxID=1576369 RepID=A0A1I3LBQ1_9PLAN|nr:hypothetical protein SAMN05421753_112208 [Planctomicrobium piriforme]